jgi:pimeloyl-ACP methyl ester carboxylesterase
VHNHGVGTKLFVREAGAGEKHLLLLHGLVASSAYWDGVASELAGEFHVTAPDLLGFGRSPWPAADYTLDEHLEALDATIDSYIPTTARFSIIAHSMGTQIAVAYALRHPGRVEKLALIGPPLFRSREEALAKTRRASPILSLMALTPVLAPVICALHEAARPVLRPLLRMALRDLPPTVAQDAAQHTWDSYLGSLDHVVLGVWLETLLPRVGVPVLILQGQEDDTADRSKLDTLASRIGARFVALPGDHNFILRTKEPALSMIRQFLKD